MEMKHKTTVYTKAVEQMEVYAKHLTACSNRSLMTVSEAISKFSAYVKCMMDNELCGAGFGANRIEEFNENLLK